MDFLLNDQEKALQELARDFAQRHVKPGILDREWIPDPNDRMPWDLVELGSQLGLRTLTVPAEYGGPDPKVSALARVLVIEEIGAADPGVATIFQTAMKDPQQIIALANKEQKDRFFPEFLRDHRHLTCTAGTEPAHGSEWQIGYEDFKFDTTARLEGDHWVINGEKYTISNGNEAKTIILYAQTDPSVPAIHGTSVFLVPRGPGINSTQIHPKIGLRMVNSARISFEDCRIPKDCLMGELNSVFEARKKLAADTNLLTAGIELGITRAAFEEALEYSKMRVQSGKPIIEHQGVGFKLAEILTLLEAMRAMTYRLAWMMDNPSERDPKYSPMLNWYAAESCYKATTLAMQILGCGGGWLTLHGQKHVRDAMVYFPNEGTHTIQLLKVLKALQAQPVGVR